MTLGKGELCTFLCKGDYGARCDCPVWGYGFSFGEINKIGGVIKTDVVGTADCGSIRSSRFGQEATYPL